ncbi:hypothetical protein ACFV4M_11930 [Kitasatospora indigofera]|uniref:hypothetical protein n=1 Tax=Kitasatospora indigofera TaxID=67307 RepID=UPI003647E540
MRLFVRALVVGDIGFEQVAEITAASLDSFSHNPFFVFADGWEIEVGTTSDLRGDATWQPGIERSTFHLDCRPDDDLPWQDVHAALERIRQGFEAAGTRLARQLVDQLTE